MISLSKEEEAKLESQRQRFSPSSPGSSRSVPFRDDPTETDALLGELEHHPAWRSSIRGSDGSPPSGSGRPSPRTSGRTFDETYHNHHRSSSGDQPYNDEPPPSFAPYQAEYFEIGNEDICSHDPHLNSDGEALYRFILARSQRPPFLRVHVKGSHTEHKTRWVTRTGSDGRSHQELESYSETVTDFNFCVDIKPVIYTTRASDGSVGGPVPIDPIHWSVPDNVPAYRGKMVKEVEEMTVPGLGGLKRIKRKAKRKETRARAKWLEEVAARGLPPWCEEAEVDLEEQSSSSVTVENLADLEQHPLRSSKSIRQWADEYCASPKRLKEFVYTQELYGWNIQQIESAIRSTVRATPYNGDLEISFSKHRSKIYIRPDNRLSRMLSNKWLKFLSIILLIFPFIWLFKRFHSRGGGRWEVCGGAYPLKRWVPMDEDDEGAPRSDSSGLPPYAPYEDTTISIAPPSPWQIPRGTSPSSGYDFNSIARTRSSSSRVMHTASGPKKLLGLREGEWFRRWEGSIARAVMARYQSSDPLPDGSYVSTSVLSLDGY